MLFPLQSNATAQGRQTCGPTSLKMPQSFARGTDFEKPPRCLPSLAADCWAILYIIS